MVTRTTQTSEALPQFGDDRAPGEVTHLDDAWRVRIPAGVFQRVGWPRKQPSISLVAELGKPGCVRLHVAEQVAQKLEAALASLRQENGPNLAERLAAFEDRFRLVTLQTRRSEYRVTLGETISAFLGIGEANPLVYVEATPPTVQIVTPSYRQERLAKHRFELDIDLD